MLYRSQAEASRQIVQHNQISNDNEVINKVLPQLISNRLKVHREIGIMIYKRFMYIYIIYYYCFFI